VGKSIFLDFSTVKPTGCGKYYYTSLSYYTVVMKNEERKMRDKKLQEVLGKKV
jgi:hypothetical protein